MKKFKFLKSKKIRLSAIIAGALIVIISIISTINLSKAKNSECNLEKVVAGNLERVYSITGQVSSSNITDITTAATGVIKEIYVKDGAKVYSGQKIALLELDQQSQALQAKNYAVYLAALSAYETVKNGQTALKIEGDSAGNNIETIEQSKLSLNVAIQNAQKVLLETQKNYNDIKKSIYIGALNPLTNNKYSKSDLDSAALAVKIAEDNLAIAKQNLAKVDTTIDIAKKQAALNNDKQQSYSMTISEAAANVKAAWLSYELTSSVIKAPISGVVKGVKIIPGTIIKKSNSSTGFKIANIETSGKPLITADATEAEAPFIQLGQKAIVRLDSVSNKEFEGKILSINVVSDPSASNANYEVVIELNEASANVLSNMAADIDIIPQTKENVLLISNSAIDGIGEKAKVKKYSNGKLEETKIEAGDESEKTTEIKSGLNIGDLVLTNFYDKKVSSSCKF